MPHLKIFVNRQIHFLGLLVTLFASKFAISQNIQKPNIIYILADDLGYGDVGVFYQNKRKAQSLPHLLTPSLDRMAASGAILSQNYCNAPVCVSSRSSLMSGVTQGHSGVRDNQFDKALDDNYTIANTLKSVGYTTVAIGKWGLQGKGKEATNWPAHPLKRGFDDYYGYIRHADGHEHYPKEGLYRGRKEIYDGYKVVTDDLDKCYTGDLFTAKAKQWIKDHTRTKKATPFFMYLAFDTPHAVIELPTQAYPAGSGLKGGLQWLGEKGRMINTASGAIDSWMSPNFANQTYAYNSKASTEKKPWPDVYKRYATVVERLDAQVGDLLQLLKDLNIDKNTLIVFTSDNGPSQESYLKEDYSPEFFRGYGPFDGIKRDVWEGGTRVPTLVQWAGKIKAGADVKTPSMSSDWMTTFLAASGYKAPARSDGTSLLPSLLGKGSQQAPTVYIEYTNNTVTPKYKDFEEVRRGTERNQMQMIRLGNYLGVRYNINSHADDFEIYDVVKDPKETTNMASSMRQLQQQMKNRVLQMRMPDTSSARPYDNEYVPSLSGRTYQKGVTWKEYSGNFLWVPQTTGLTPSRTGQVSKKDLFKTEQAKAPVIHFEGFINVPEDGEYSFFLSTSGKAFLRIHDASVIDADYNYEPGSERNGRMRLKAGLHPFKLTVLRVSNKDHLNLQWSSDKFGKRNITAENLY